MNADPRYLLAATALLLLAVIAAAGYGLFLAGLVNVLAYVGYLGWIQAVVAVLALVFALVNIKDYFWFKQGLSFTIADRHKPGYMRVSAASWPPSLAVGRARRHGGHGPGVTLRAALHGRLSGALVHDPGAA